MATDTAPVTTSPDAIRAAFHAAHTRFAGSEDLDGFRDWGEKFAAYVGELHAKVEAQAADIATLKDQMAAVIDGVAELGGATPAAAAPAPAAEDVPTAPADPAPVAEAVGAAPVEAAPVEPEAGATAPVEASPVVASEAAAVDPAPADAPAAG